MRKFGFAAYFSCYIYAATYLVSRGVKIRLLEKPGSFFPVVGLKACLGGVQCAAAQCVQCATLGGVQQQQHSDSSSGCSHVEKAGAPSLHFRSSSFCRIHQRPRGMHHLAATCTSLLSDEQPPYSVTYPKIPKKYQEEIQKQFREKSKKRNTPAPAPPYSLMSNQSTTILFPETTPSML